ncbi:DNA cytosine methyltransferase [Mycoplasma sp. 1458C]|uniref:DNA cytosine methyltransferase n=1 Tax=Mycoplasma TaxID=2093 RepID=UPI003A853E87
MKNKYIIDLFAGCGGLSTGYEMEGFKTLIAVEKDLWASETFKYNHKEATVITTDITKLHDIHSYYDSHISPVGVIGGPPCQGFSLSGKRDKNDPRNSLFMDFIRIVKQVMPPFFMMENVPGILSMKTKENIKVIDIILDEYKKAGYNSTYFILNAADYGVPQTRKRVIFIGIRNDIPYYPDELKPDVLFNEDNYISIDSAISDLEPINAGEGAEISKYKMPPKTNFQVWARENSTDVYNHVAMKHTQRIIDRFKIIPNGCSLADVPKEHMQRKRGNISEISGKVYAQNNMRPYGDKPSPTIAASFQGNFIHPHLNRNFTAREAARLQSFPDWYVFQGKRTTMSWEKNLSQYQQIGNAVPPLLAKAIAKKIKEYLIKYLK